MSYDNNRILHEIEQERARQIHTEGFDEEHDDLHNNGELAAAAACYASPLRAFRASGERGRGGEIHVVYRDLWPFTDKWWKPKLDRRSDLITAAALIVAEIERIDRADIKRRQEGRK